MKRIQYIMLAVAALSLTACEGFFNNESPSAIDASAVFSNPVNTEQAIYGVYDLFGKNNSYLNRLACGYNGLNTDIEYSTKSTSTDGVEELMLYDCSLGNTNVSSVNGTDIWSYLNTMIERCNNIIEGLDQYGDVEHNATMAYYLGEAHFLRAFATLEQVKYWGDVPARFVSLAKDEKGVDARKADRNLCYEQIRLDLNRAAELLPWSAECPESVKNNVGRASKAAALALLARADLMYAGKAVRPNTIEDPSGYSVTFNVTDADKRQQLYKEALDACAQIIATEDFKLAADFATPFKQICSDVTDYSKMEHIWVIPFADGARGRVLNYNAPKLSDDAKTAVPGHLHGYAKGGKSNGHVCISPAFIFQFDKADKRREVTFVTGQWEYNNGASEVSDDSARAVLFPIVAPDTVSDPNALRLFQKHNSIDKFFLGKYRFEWMASTRALSNDEDDVDFPILRYADVLLMFAEASLGGISGDAPANESGLSPVEQVNKLRRRAGVPELATLDMDAIKQERAFELCGEYVRKYDLMRWGCLRESLVATQNTVRKMATSAGRAELNIADSICYKYRYDSEVKGYVMDSIYGLAKGETARPATFNKATGWQIKGIYYSDSKGNLLHEDNYPIFVAEENLETRQYWPIFATNIAASNGTLWNNYGY